MRRSSAVLAVMSVLVSMLVGSVAPAAADTAHGTPNDPGFARCENDPNARADGCDDNEQWDMYGPLDSSQHSCPPPQNDPQLPCFAPLASDPDHMSGLDFTGAWRQGNLGRGDVLIAYIEGGVNYSSDDIKDGLNAVFLNTKELPYPEHPDGSSYSRYDANRDGRVDIRDYVGDPRVNPKCSSYTAHVDLEGTTRSCMPNGRHAYLNRVHIGGTLTRYLSPEDLIAVFGHCQIQHHHVVTCPRGGKFDNDGNGYPNDISGWNTYRNNNDPQTEDLAYNHAPGLISLIGGQPDNHFAGVGACARCRVVPIKQGAECLGRTDKEVEALAYAVDIGAAVVSSVVVSYTYSKYDQVIADWAYHHGVVLSLDSNDFDAMDHTNGMYLDHAIPGNSLAEDKGGPAASETRWYRARSNVTSYGTHNIFSYGEYTTSGATPFGASTLAMVVSAGLNAVGKHVIPSRLTPDEVKQIVMDTAQPVIPQTQAPDVAPSQWPGNPDSATDATHTNWSTQYGYGRPDVGAATKMVMAGKIPPHAELTSPRWYAYVDPFRQSSLPVTGIVARSRVHSGGKAHYVAEWALGADPKDSDFHPIAHGSVQSTSGKLGAIDLSDAAIRDYAAKAPGTTLQPDGAEQYTMTIRLRVWDDNGLKAEDRRSVGLRHDPTLVRGFPVDLDRGEIANTATADLEGKRQLDLVVATNNGDLHAFRPNGSEVPGFPVHSDALRTVDRTNPQNLASFTYKNNALLRNQPDPLSGGVAVGDLFHDGRLFIAATSAEGDLYVWDAHGRRLHGFPKYMPDPAAQVPTPRAPTDHGRLPARGAWAPPVLADLEGTHRLDILMTGYDGKVRAYRPDGHVVPGWPVTIRLPAAQRKALGSSYFRDPKLLYPVTVARLTGSRRPQVLVPSFEGDGPSTGTENLGAALLGLPPFDSSVAHTYLYAMWPDGRKHKGGAFLPHWPVHVDVGSFSYDQSIDFVGESTSPADVVKVGGEVHILTAPITGVVHDYAPDGTQRSTSFDASCSSSDCGNAPMYRVPDSHTIELSGIGSLGDLDADGTPEYIANATGVESIEASLSVPGVANLPQVYERAWNIADGSSVSGFPRRVDGFPFYSSPTTASVDGGAGRAAIEGNDTYWVHAFHGDGSEAAGFPKYTGQWMSFSSTVWDPRMNGHVHVVDPTREGFLYDWATSGRVAQNDSWWTYRHDDRRTGDYGVDSRRPAALTDLHITKGRLAWTASGDDYMVGTARRYDIRWSTSPITLASFRKAARLKAPAPKPARTPQWFGLPSSVRSHSRYYVAARAIDDAGNLGALVVICHGCKTPQRHSIAAFLVPLLGRGAGSPPGLAAGAALALLLRRRRAVALSRWASPGGATAAAGYAFRSFPGR